MSEVTPDLFQPSDYTLKKVDTPPTLKEIDGRWFIEIHDGSITVQAPIGWWFMRQLLERVILPLLFVKEHGQG